jgi:polyhydroxybutyrate depolymerase
VVGQSHGAFMAYHMACDSSDLIAGIAIHAGATFLDPTRCTPSEPVNILHTSGTADAFVGYWGGVIHHEVPPRNWPPYPGAVRTAEIWAGYNGASNPVTDSTPTLDLDGGLPGLDTVVTRYTTYPPGGAVELWTINDGSHYPTLSSEFSP